MHAHCPSPDNSKVSPPYQSSMLVKTNPDSRFSPCRRTLRSRHRAGAFLEAFACAAVVCSPNRHPRLAPSGAGVQREGDSARVRKHKVQAQAQTGFVLSGLPSQAGEGQSLIRQRVTCISALVPLPSTVGATGKLHSYLARGGERQSPETSTGERARKKEETGAKAERDGLKGS